MTKIWRVVAAICVLLLILSLALIGVAYATGGSFARLNDTTDIMDMTKFLSREQLEQYVTQGVNIINSLLPG